MNVFKTVIKILEPKDGRGETKEFQRLLFRGCIEAGSIVICIPSAFPSSFDQSKVEKTRFYPMKLVLVGLL